MFSTSMSFVVLPLCPMHIWSALNQWHAAVLIDCGQVSALSFAQLFLAIFRCIEVLYKRLLWWEDLHGITGGVTTLVQKLKEHFITVLCMSLGGETEFTQIEHSREARPGRVLRRTHSLPLLNRFCASRCRFWRQCERFFQVPTPKSTLRGGTNSNLSYTELRIQESQSGVERERVAGFGPAELNYKTLKTVCEMDFQAL